MTTQELIKKLKKNGWSITEGGNHSQAKHPDHPGVKISIPRHKGDVPKGTLNNILRLTGLK